MPHLGNESTPFLLAELRPRGGNYGRVGIGECLRDRTRQRHPRPEFRWQFMDRGVESYDLGPCCAQFDRELDSARSSERACPWLVCQTEDGNPPFGKSSETLSKFAKRPRTMLIVAVAH